MPATQPQPTTAAEAARGILCPLCWAPTGKPCQRQPAGDHLGRWVAAHRANLISRGDLADVIDGLVVIADSAIVPECEHFLPRSGDAA